MAMVVEEDRPDGAWKIGSNVNFLAPRVMGQGYDS